MSVKIGDLISCGLFIDIIYKYMINLIILLIKVYL